MSEAAASTRPGQWVEAAGSPRQAGSVSDSHSGAGRRAVGPPAGSLLKTGNLPDRMWNRAKNDHTLGRKAKAKSTTPKTIPLGGPSLSFPSFLSPFQTHNTLRSSRALNSLSYKGSNAMEIVWKLFV